MREKLLIFSFVVVLHMNVGLTHGQDKRDQVDFSDLTGEQILNKLVANPEILEHGYLDEKLSVKQWICRNMEADVIIDHLLKFKKRTNFKLTAECVKKYVLLKFAPGPAINWPENKNPKYLKRLLDTSFTVEDQLKHILIANDGFAVLDAEDIADMIRSATERGFLRGVVFFLRNSKINLAGTRNIQSALGRCFLESYYSICEALLKVYQPDRQQLEIIATRGPVPSSHGEFEILFKHQIFSNYSKQKVKSHFAACCDTSIGAFRKTLKLFVQNKESAEYLRAKPIFHQHLKKFDLKTYEDWASNRL